MITEGYLARHYQGRHGGRDPALLDVAQDYALKFLSDNGIFELGLTFKGGTALRKYRAGNLGRFSTDLDFAAAEEAVADIVLDVLNGAELHEVGFTVEVVTPHRRGQLTVTTPLGSPAIDARIEITLRSPWLPCERLAPVDFPVHQGYEFRPVAAPVMSLEETFAEKIAAYRRRALLRDLYDLAWFAMQGAFDEPLIRRLTYLKVYVDVVEEGIASAPFNPVDDLFGRQLRDFPPEDIGLLTGEPDIEAWLERVRDRFSFLADPTSEEERVARCDPRDRYTVGQTIAALPAL
ncbi:MAG: nucleotidyl transferase AbiEii/AbiGii toxin family protein [Acidimicrobiia bacterium]